MRLDKNGISLTERLGKARIQSRDISELIGLCMGVLADGTVNIQEAAFILKWLNNHPQILDIWPADYLYGTLSGVLANGKLSSEDEGELLDVMVAITGVPITIAIPISPRGGREQQTLERTVSSPATLPLNEPEQGMVLEGAFIVLTGNFLYGSRADCEAAVKRNGGTPQKRVMRTTKYLVIGEVGSESWAHSSFGRKIEAAVAAKDAGQDIYIVSESFWAKHLSEH